MTAYIIKSSLSLIILFGLYWFLLRKEKLFVFNRFFLVLSVVFSLIVPFISIPVSFRVAPQVDKIITSENYFIPLISSPGVVSPEMNTSQQYSEQQPASVNFPSILLASYYAGVILFLIRFLKNISVIIHKMKQSEKIRNEGYRIVLTNDRIGPYCFFRNIFLNREDYLSGRIERELIIHETEHARQSHTIDIIFIELLKIFYWFNPVYILYDRAIRINHEYLADNGVISEKPDINSYADKLLSFVAGQNSISLTSGSNNSFTRMRLIMMMKSEPKGYIYGARVMMSLAMGLLFSLLLSFTQSENESPQSAISETGSQNEENIVRGTVVNEEGDPIKGASVIISGTSRQVSTDATGAFTIGNVPVNAHLIISSKGCVSQYLEPAFTSEMAVRMMLDKGNPESLLISSSFKNGPHPLILTNGRESDKRFDEIDKSKINGMMIIPGKEAVNVYGEKGKNGVIIVYLKKEISPGNASENLVRGIVLTEKGDPLKEATIVCTGPQKTPDGVTTGSDGRFAITGVEIGDSLVIGCFGYKKQTIVPDFSAEMIVKLTREALFPEIKLVNFRNPDFSPTQAFIVINGKILNRKDKLKVDIDEIKSVNVLSNMDALDKYGEKGKDGAVEILLYKKKPGFKVSNSALAAGTDPDTSKNRTVLHILGSPHNEKLIDIPVSDLKSLSMWTYPIPADTNKKSVRYLGITTRDFYKVKGSVVSTDGKPLPGVTITVTDNPVTVISDKNGRFLFEDVREDAMLEFYLSGYKPYYLITSTVVFTIDLKIELEKDSAGKDM
jgi:hypothetical protein